MIFATSVVIRTRLLQQTELATPASVPFSSLGSSERAAQGKRTLLPRPGDRSASLYCRVSPPLSPPRPHENLLQEGKCLLCMCREDAVSGWVRRPSGSAPCGS